MTRYLVLGGRQAGKATAAKYGNEKTRGYPSKREARRGRDLELLQHAGAIRNLRRQVPFVLIPVQRDARGEVLELACTYRADFCYDEMQCGLEQDLWVPVVEDSKGARTRDYVIKRKLMLMVHKIRVRET
jgi:hypothetical protein